MAKKIGVEFGKTLMSEVLVNILATLATYPKPKAPPGHGKRFAAQWRAGRMVAGLSVASRQAARRRALVNGKAHFMGQRRTW